jgi:hypothetical protein
MVKNTLRPILIPTKYTKKCIKINRVISEEYDHTYDHIVTRDIYILD